MEFYDYWKNKLEDNGLGIVLFIFENRTGKKNLSDYTPPERNNPLSFMDLDNVRIDHLPPLEGTEKQSEWANEIRKIFMISQEFTLELNDKVLLQLNPYYQKTQENKDSRDLINDFYSTFLKETRSRVWIQWFQDLIRIPKYYLHRASQEDIKEFLAGCVCTVILKFYQDVPKEWCPVKGIWGIIDIHNYCQGKFNNNKIIPKVRFHRYTNPYFLKQYKEIMSVFKDRKE